MPDGSFFEHKNEPFVFIKKGCDEEDQTLLMENTMKLNLIGAEVNESNTFKRRIEALKAKLKYQLMY